MSELSKQDRIYFAGVCYECFEVLYGKESSETILFHELDDQTLVKTAQTLQDDLYRRRTI